MYVVVELRGHYKSWQLSNPPSMRTSTFKSTGFSNAVIGSAALPRHITGRSNSPHGNKHCSEFCQAFTSRRFGHHHCCVHRLVSMTVGGSHQVLGILFRFVNGKSSTLCYDSYKSSCLNHCVLGDGDNSCVITHRDREPVSHCMSCFFSVTVNFSSVFVR